MEEDNKFSFKTIWSIIMFLVYMFIAYLVAFTPYMLPYNYRENAKENDDFVLVRIFLGVALFLYGLFRGYRIIKYKK